MVIGVGGLGESRVGCGFGVFRVRIREIEDSCFCFSVCFCEMR